MINLRLRFEFAISSKQKGVNQAKVHALLKDFDFGQFASTDRTGWLQYLGRNTSPACTDESVHFTASLASLGEKTNRSLGVTFHQRSDGVIIITIHRTRHSETPYVKLEIHLKEGMTEKSVTCISQWKVESHLVNIALHLMKLRNRLVQALGKEVGFHGAEIGTRLSRKSPNLAPDIAISEDTHSATVREPATPGEPTPTQAESLSFVKTPQAVPTSDPTIEAPNTPEEATGNLVSDQPVPIEKSGGSAPEEEDQAHSSPALESKASPDQLTS